MNLVLKFKGRYCSIPDEIYFFRWVRRINSAQLIESTRYNGWSKLIIVDSPLLKDLYELFGLFKRYFPRSVSCKKIEALLGNEFSKLPKQWRPHIEQPLILDNDACTVNREVCSSMLWCKRMRFYSEIDNEIFFEWVNKISAIKKIYHRGNAIGLWVPTNRISRADLREILALFTRYNVNMYQCRRFLTKKNTRWFSSVCRDWFRNIFPEFTSSKEFCNRHLIKEWIPGRLLPEQLKK